MTQEETEKQLIEDTEAVRQMVGTRGWDVVKAKFDAKIFDLQNIFNIDSEDAATMVADVKARRMAVDLLYAFLKNDVYGFMEQQDANRQQTQARSESYIEREK